MSSHVQDFYNRFWIKPFSGMHFHTPFSIYLLILFYDTDISMLNLRPHIYTAKFCNTYKSICSIIHTWIKIEKYRKVAIHLLWNQLQELLFSIQRIFFYWYNACDTNYTVLNMDVVPRYSCMYILRKKLKIVVTLLSH